MLSIDYATTPFEFAINGIGVSLMARLGLEKESF
jgi:hypothetical protein